jgi:RHS repeat-associated protein
MPMPNRQLTGSEQYRYGYQGEFAETDSETGKTAFQLRIYDPRIGRWLTVDPMGQYHSPYMAMDNRPNMSVDPTGGCTVGVDCPEDFNWMGEGTWVMDEVGLNGFEGTVNWGSASITGGGLIDFSMASAEDWSQIFGNKIQFTNDQFMYQTGGPKSYDYPTSTVATFAGGGIAATRGALFNKSKWWTGANGKMYDFNFNGSGSTGGRNSFARSSSKALGKVGFGIGLYGLYDTRNQYINGEIGKARMYQDQSFNFAGFLGPVGAAASFGYNLGYVIEDACNCTIRIDWERRRLQNGTIFTNDFLH